MRMDWAKYEASLAGWGESNPAHRRDAEDAEKSKDLITRYGGARGESALLLAAFWLRLVTGGFFLGRFGFDQCVGLAD